MSAARKLSKAGLGQRQEAPVRHGGYSPARIRARARAHRRRFLRQARMKASALDPIAAGYLDGWARSLAKVDLFNIHEDRNSELLGARALAQGIHGRGFDAGEIACAAGLDSDRTAPTLADPSREER